MRKDSVNIKNLRDDISHILSRSSLSKEERDWFARVYMREVIREEHFWILERVSSSDNIQPVQYRSSCELRREADYILDWLAELEERDPRLHAKLPRINFRQAYHHSKRWHRELARAGEKHDRRIEPDPKGAPPVLDLGEGWEVIHLVSDEARDIEGDVMDHCVGGGGYDSLDEGEAVFSLRNNNIPHVTLYLRGLTLVEAEVRGGAEVPQRYQPLLDEAEARLGPLLLLGMDLSAKPKDGAYQSLDGGEIHIKDGKLHCESGPAVIYPGVKEEWRLEGRIHREDGPSVVYADGRQEWWAEGKRHREGGPAITSPDGWEEWYQNGLRHRDCGPAVTYPDGRKAWWVNGRIYSPGASRLLINI